MSVLNVGCGVHPLEGAVNLDIADYPGVDVVHDLDTPWPFPDGSFDHVLAVQVFEHVAEPLLFMAEAWRVLRPAGTLEIHVPSWKSRNSYTDPTHRRHCTPETFDYWIRGTPLNGTHGQVYARGREFMGTVTPRHEDLIALLYRLELQ